VHDRAAVVVTEEDKDPASRTCWIPTLTLDDSGSADVVLH